MSQLSRIYIAVVYIVVINVVTFFLYGADKFKAKHSMWRISEATLIWFSVIGGSIGAGYSHSWFRGQNWGSSTTVGETDTTANTKGETQSETIATIAATTITAVMAITICFFIKFLLCIKNYTY